MTLSTYAGMLASVQDWLHRTDVAAPAVDFIRLAEVELSARLDHRNMETVSTISITGETYTLPDQFDGVLSLRVNSQGAQKVHYMSPEALDDQPFNEAGTPRNYTIAGGSLVFWPIPAAAVAARFRYRTKLTPIDASNSNWVLEDYPNAYLYGALMQAAPYVKDDARVAVWDMFFERAIKMINDDGIRQSLGASMQTQSGISDTWR